MRTSRPNPVRREVDRFRAEPASLRNAAAVLISVTVAAVLLGSLVMWLFDKRDFADYGTALWFTIQTVTTVGYGDVTPESGVGRVVAAVVMIVAIGFLSIVTALITSTFIDAAQRRRLSVGDAAQRDETERVHARFDELDERLSTIEASLARLEGREPDQPPSTDPPPPSVPPPA